MNGKRRLLAVLLVIGISSVLFAVKSHSVEGGFGLCGDFCQRLGCKQKKSLHGPSANQARTEADQRTVEAPDACQLSDGEFGERIGLVRELYSGVVSTRELEDGYELTFPGEAVWGEKLFNFVRAERQCCPFFLFELKFEPHRGPIRLSLRGGAEVKEFLDNFTMPAAS